MGIFRRFYDEIISLGTSFQDILLLLIRLYWGYSFFTGGLGKLEDIPTVASFFESLNIPFPVANAYLVGAVECFGGLFLMLGFATRLAAIPLICTMLVALLTAHKDAVSNLWESPYDILKDTPFTYLMAALILFAFGPGRVSIDALLKRAFFSSGKKK